MQQTRLPWEKQLQTLTWLIHYIFLAPSVIIVATYFLYPPDPRRWHLSYESLFYGLLSLGAISFPLMGWFYRQLISLESLEMRKRGVGLESSFAAFRSGMIVSACMGEFCSFLCLFFYLVARDPGYSAVFCGLWGLHYVLATVWLRRAFDDFTLLTREPSIVATDSIRRTGTHY